MMAQGRVSRVIQASAEQQCSSDFRIGVDLSAKNIEHRAKGRWWWRRGNATIHKLRIEWKS